jgi:hypothetical protein
VDADVGALPAEAVEEVGRHFGGQLSRWSLERDREKRIDLYMYTIPRIGSAERFVRRRVWSSDLMSGGFRGFSTAFFPELHPRTRSSSTLHNPRSWFVHGFIYLCLFRQQQESWQLC